MRPRYTFIFLCPRVRQILFFFEWAVNVAHVSILGNLLYFLFCSYTYTIYSNWQSSSRLLFFPSFRPFPSLFFSSLPLPSCLFIFHLFCCRKKVPLACWRVRCRCACRLAAPLAGLLLQNGSHGGYGVLQLDGCGSVAPVEFQYH